MRVALILNLLGWACLFLSFQATSSNFKLVTAPDGKSALCVNGRALIVSLPQGGTAIGMNVCPDWEHARPAAVVNIEIPSMVTLGFIFITAGFLLQFLSIPGPRTIAQMRHELKEAQMQSKIDKSRGSK
jgi:hypothetical protein